MTTPAEYTAGMAAAMTVLKDKESAYVPKLFQSEIIVEMLQDFANAMSRAAIDAAAAVRASTQQQT
jgi:hypothetical protein